MFSLITSLALTIRITAAFLATYLTEDFQQDQSLLIEKVLRSYPELALSLQSPTFFEKNLNPLPELLIYFPQSELFMPKLTNIANLHQIPTIVYSKGNNSDSVFFTHPTNDCLAGSVKSMMTEFKMTQNGILWEWGQDSQDLIEKFKQNFRISNSVCIQKSEKKISEILAKFFKARAITDLLIVGKGKAQCENIETGIFSNKMEKIWNLIVYIGECTCHLTRNGNFGLIYSPLNSAKSDYDYTNLSLTQYLHLIKSAEQTKYQLKNLFDKVEIKCEYSIINIKNSKKVNIGKIINKSIEFYSNPTFFTGSNNRSSNSRPSLQFSSNTGTRNPNGRPDIIQNSKYQKGTYFAVDQINANHELFPEFDFKLFDQVNCGVNYFEYNYSRECFLNVSDELGVAYIPPLYGTTMIPVLNQFKDLNFSVPAVAGLGSASVLSNSSVFPYFKRMVSPLNLNLQVFAKYLSIMKWQNVAVFYSNEPFGLTIYSLLEEYAITYKYKIINDEEFRKVDYIYSYTNGSEYTKNLDDLYNTNCNILLLAMSDPAPYFWLEILYDYGFRKGDLTIFFFTVTGTDALNTTTGNFTKRSELMNGSFVIYNAAWVGSYGDSIKTEYLTANPSSWMPGFYIDAVYTIAHTVKFLLSQGKDYESGKIFMQAAQYTKFLGVTGTVSFDFSSNDRNLFYFNIYNFYESNGVWHSTEVGLISPLSSVYYQILAEYVWPSGSQPTDLKLKYLNCEFIKAHVKASMTSQNLQLGIIFSLLFLFIVLAVSIQFKLNVEKNSKIEVKTKALFMDYFVMVFIFVESLQLVSIGPSTGRFNKFLANVCKLFSFQLNDFWDFRDREYWQIYFGFLIFGYVWVTICVLDSRVVKGLVKNQMVKLAQFKSFMVPVVSNFMFIPISSQLLKIFSCKEGLGDKLTESFFDYDCSVWCWKTKHLTILICTIILLCILVPSSIYYRIIWSRGNSNVNIKESNIYITIKSIIQLTLIGLDQSLRIRNELLHAILFFIVVFAFNTIFLFKPPFNFDRADLCSRILSTCVAWNTIVCIVELSIKLKVYILLSLQIGGWVLIISIGIVLYIRLPPSILISKKGRTVVELFKFIFGRGEYVASKYIKNATTLNPGGEGFISELRDNTEKLDCIENQDFSNIQPRLNIEKNQEISGFVVNVNCEEKKNCLFREEWDDVHSYSRNEKDFEDRLSIQSYDENCEDKLSHCSNEKEVQNYLDDNIRINFQEILKKDQNSIENIEGL